MNSIQILVVMFAPCYPSLSVPVEQHLGEIKLPLYSSTETYAAAIINGLLVAVFTLHWCACLASMTSEPSKLASQSVAMWQTDSQAIAFACNCSLLHTFIQTMMTLAKVTSYLLLVSQSANVVSGLAGQLACLLWPYGLGFPADWRCPVCVVSDHYQWIRMVTWGNSVSVSYGALLVMGGEGGGQQAA